MSITKFMVSVGPIHERDLSDVVKQLEDYPDIRVSTYNTTKIKRVLSKTKEKIIRKTVTPEAAAEMRQLILEGKSEKDVAFLTGYSLITVQRHTRKVETKQRELIE